MSSITKDQLFAALKKLGASKPGDVAEHLEVDYKTSGLAKIVKECLDSKEIKAIGATVSRRIALPDQKFEDTGAPPQERKAPKVKKPRKAKRARKAPKARRAPQARILRKGPAERFIPTVDAEKRLHLINGSEPVSFTDQQTEAIATLLFLHYAP